MRFQLPLVRGTLIRRYKRFLADVSLEDGRVVTAHCPNSGSMKTCAEPGRPVLLADHGLNTKRKLRYTWEAHKVGRAWVGINTLNPNRVVREAIEAGSVPELTGYNDVRSEVKYGVDGRSRIDLLLSSPDLPACYVEVKNVTMRVDDGALFPDAVTERGRKHLLDLAREVRRGNRAVIFFFVGRADCHWMGPADEIDVEYGKTLRRVTRRGVEALAYQARVSPRGIVLTKPIEVRLG